MYSVLKMYARSFLIWFPTFSYHVDYFMCVCPMFQAIFIPSLRVRNKSYAFLQSAQQKAGYGIAFLHKQRATDQVSLQILSYMVIDA